jgi:hypothetical protein
LNGRRIGTFFFFLAADDSYGILIYFCFFHYV